MFGKDDFSSKVTGDVVLCPMCGGRRQVLGDGLILSDCEICNALGVVPCHDDDDEVEREEDEKRKEEEQEKKKEEEEEIEAIVIAPAKSKASKTMRGRPRKMSLS